MSKGREIRCFDYVNQPYAPVRDALTRDTTELFAAATKDAASRANRLAAELRVDVGAIELATEIAISVHEVTEEPRGTRPYPVTRIRLEWEATRSPHLFPFMAAEIAVYPLTSTETQLELVGRYTPPMGALGRALDAVAGHRVAEASVHRFVHNVAEHLRRSLA